MKDPFAQFNIWYHQAEHKTLWRRFLTWLYPPAVIHQPDAMILSTVDSQDRPSSRVVLLKSASQSGFVFFTNYKSRKAQELDQNPNVSLLFHWAFPERQVRIEGIAQKTSRKENEDYWKTRPRGSQLSGAISPQSEVIEDRSELVKKVEELKKKSENQEIICPEFWGGYCVIPQRIEFWEARANRLHERVVFIKQGEGWTKRLLAP